MNRVFLFLIFYGFYLFLMSGCMSSPVIFLPQDSSVLGGVTGEIAPSSFKEQPGLATKWGEKRTSRVHSVLFSRANLNNPTATATIYYNNEEGIMAMTGISAYNAGWIATLSPIEPYGFVSFGIHSEEGMALKEITVYSRRYVVGKSGQRYSIRVRNNTNKRLEAVLSVDGIDVLDGKAASFAKQGYVIAPYSSLKVEGFRQSMDAVAAFRFGSIQESYANKKHEDTRNVGVIGLAIFHERGTDPFTIWTHDDIKQRKAADPFPGRFATPAD
ncbi:hypothetical protein [Candidatus Parabeggiatoa sp. HSG14]|uniref:hypothetical protein n=1 Tax=Candidatus Parabeggiatoa sp. HSG14 TaxID=3055593 RepID=UPI0025A90717|nr:hypothetical protein [Thiotrichales bacterium HSG14]